MPKQKILSAIAFTKANYRVFVAELLGTFLLVFVCVAATLPLGSHNPTVLDCSLANGFAVATLMTIFSPASGCHINPAVTLALLTFKRIELKNAILYITAQCVGALVGASVLLAITPDGSEGGFGVVQPGKDVSIAEAFGLEFSITFILLFVIFASTDENRKSEARSPPPIAVGFTVMICSLIGIQYSGACMNPARSFGPAVATFNLDHHWIYWLSPVTGGICGSAVYQWSFTKKPSSKTSSAPDLNSTTLKNVNEDIESEEPIKDICCK